MKRLPLRIAALGFCASPFTEVSPGLRGRCALASRPLDAHRTTRPAVAWRFCPANESYGHAA